LSFQETSAQLCKRRHGGRDTRAMPGQEGCQRRRNIEEKRQSFLEQGRSKSSHPKQGQWRGCGRGAKGLQPMEASIPERQSRTTDL